MNPLPAAPGACGPHTEKLSDGQRRWDVGDTRKYVLVGNMVTSIVAMVVGINEQLSDGNHHPNLRHLVHGATERVPRVPSVDRAAKS
jgi:hypothetical protein